MQASSKDLLVFSHVYRQLEAEGAVKDFPAFSKTYTKLLEMLLVRSHPNPHHPDPHPHHLEESFIGGAYERLKEVGAGGSTLSHVFQAYEQLNEVADEDATLSHFCEMYPQMAEAGADQAILANFSNVYLQLRAGDANRSDLREFSGKYYQELKHQQELQPQGVDQGNPPLDLSTFYQERVKEILNGIKEKRKELVLSYKIKELKDAGVTDKKILSEFEEGYKQKLKEGTDAVLTYISEFWDDRMLSYEIAKLKDAGVRDEKILSEFEEGYKQKREKETNSNLDYVKDFWDKRGIKRPDVKETESSSSNTQDTSASTSPRAEKPTIEITLESIRKMPEWESADVKDARAKLEKQEEKMKEKLEKRGRLEGQDEKEWSENANELLVEFQFQLDEINDEIEKSNKAREAAEEEPKLNLHDYLTTLKQGLETGKPRSLAPPTDAS